VHVSSPRQERWQRLKETDPILRRVAALQEAYQESENPVVSSMRSVTSTVASWFDENETARVLRSMKMLDPSFSMESFERELREYIVPEVVDAYLSADNDALKSWCSEAVRISQSMKKTKAVALISVFLFFLDLQRTLGDDGAVS
jgi:import inner membrane translocase subunit TIM44